MKKVYRMRNLDCANCALKMERGISKIDGVASVGVNFMLQRLTLELCEGADEAAVLALAKKVVAKVDADCEIIG